MSLLVATAIRKSFAGVRALRGVSFDLAPGAVHALVGENGAGKSTLIKIMTGAERADDGSLVLDGHAVALDAMTPAISRARGIAPIYQQPALFPDLTVSENIALAVAAPRAWARIDWRARRTRARQYLDRIGASIDPERLVRTLSLPEQQLVEIAKAVGADARIVLMDEPTASLTHRDVDRLFDVVTALKAHGAGILYISHRLEEVFQIADRITVLRDGETVASGPRDAFSRADLVRAMAGRELSAVVPPRSGTPGDVALEVRHLSNDAAGLHDISLTVRRGEILGLAGLVGSGRTELAETIFGLRHADGGDIRIDGVPRAIRSAADAKALGLAYVPEDRRHHGVILEMPVAANVSLTVLRDVSRHGIIDANRERALATGYAQRLAIKTSSIEAAVGTLSGGNQQKVSLGRWLATGPRVLMLDEPTQGVDVGAKAEIHRLVRDLVERGMAVIMISSELPEILGMSDRIAVMHRGRMAGELSREDATPERVIALALGQDRPLDGERSRRGAIPGAKSQAPDAPAAVAPTRVASGLGAIVDRHRVEASLTLAIAALAAVLLVRAPAFFQPGNLLEVLLATMPVLVTSIGATLVILIGEIDISVGSLFAIASVTAGTLATWGLPMPIVAAGTLVVSAAIGAGNGALVAGLRLPSIVVTLATMVALRDSLRWITQGAWVQNLPPGFQWLGLSQRTYPLAAVGSVAILFLAASWALRRLPGGRAIYATGSNPDAARLAGIDTVAVRLGVFVLAGVCTGLAALLDAVRFNQIPANAGVGLEMQVIAAVVVGGTAITGGRGTLVGTLLGVVLLGVMGPALTFLGASPYWERALQGAIILAAVSVDSLRARRARVDGPASRSESRRAAA